MFRPLPVMIFGFGHGKGQCFDPIAAAQPQPRGKFMRLLLTIVGTAVGWQ